MDPLDNRGLDFPGSLEREKGLLSPPKETLPDSGNTNKNKMAAKRVFDLNEASVIKSHSLFCFPSTIHMTVCVGLIIMYSTVLIDC